MKQKIDLNNLLEQNEEEPEMGDWHNHIKHLEEAHHALDKRINGLESTGVFDDIELTNLKKQRLQLKTQIVKLKQDHNPSTYYNTEQND